MFQFQLFQFVFFAVPLHLILYITIYILVSYKDYKRGVCPSNFNWNNWNWNRLAVITLLFYKALQSLAQFTVHLEGVVVNTQFSAKLWHLFQVRAIRAIILTSDCDVLSVEHMGIALLVRRSDHLHKCEMLLAVTSQHTRVRLVQLRHALHAQQRLHIHTQVGVAIQTLLLILFYRRGRCGYFCIHNHVPFRDAPSST